MIGMRAICLAALCSVLLACGSSSKSSVTGRWNVVLTGAAAQQGQQGEQTTFYRFPRTERHRTDRKPHLAGAAVKLFPVEPSSVRVRTERPTDAARGSDRKFSRYDSVAWHRNGHEPTQSGWRLGHNEWGWSLHPGIRSSFRLSVSYGNLLHEPHAVRRCPSR